MQNTREEKSIQYLVFSWKIPCLLEENTLYNEKHRPCGLSYTVRIRKSKSADDKKKVKEKWIEWTEEEETKRQEYDLQGKNEVKAARKHMWNEISVS